MSYLLKVKVTQNHIEAAKAFKAAWPHELGYGDYCPIALALADLGYPDSSVGLTTASLEKPKGKLVFGDLPPKAIEFVSRFDWGYPVRPFSFVIDVVTESYERSVC